MILLYVAYSHYVADGAKVVVSKQRAKNDQMRPDVLSTICPTLKCMIFIRKATKADRWTRCFTNTLRNRYVYYTSAIFKC